MIAEIRAGFVLVQFFFTNKGSVYFLHYCTREYIHDCFLQYRTSSSCIVNHRKACKLLEHTLEIAILQTYLTRWKSEFRLVETILSNSDSINNSLDSCGFGSLELRTHEKQTLGEILQVLDIFFFIRNILGK